MAYFRTEAEALHLAISDDGFAWTPLNGNRPLLRAGTAARTLRDPHISRAPDGRFHLVFTGGWATGEIMHAASPDLLDWSPPEAIPVMAGVPSARNCWAPECFFDPAEDSCRLLWSSTVNPDDSLDWEAPGVWNRSHDHRTWTTTTEDFARCAPARRLFDPGYSVIDATLAEHAGRYLLAFKDERGENRLGTDHKAIRVCEAPSATGPFAAISALVTPPLTEGPALLRLEGRWLMFYDHHQEGRYGASASDDGRTWTVVTDRIRFPPGARHASVLEVDDGVASPLRAKV